MLNINPAIFGGGILLRRFAVIAAQFLAFHISTTSVDQPKFSAP